MKWKLHESVWWQVVVIQHWMVVEKSLHPSFPTTTVLITPTKQLVKSFTFEALVRSFNALVLEGMEDVRSARY